MRKKQIHIIWILIFSTVSSSYAQIKSDTLVSFKKNINNTIHKSNFVKLNLTSLLLKTYSLQYERVLNKKISAAISFRIMPSTNIPFKNTILNIISEDPDAEKIINSFQLKNFAFTPEIRFYVGKKGYGQGFYIASFYRYSKYEGNNLLFTYSTSTGQEKDISLSGNLISNTAGLLFGAQWSLGKHICLDWWIFGPHYGSGNGAFAGASSQPLTQAEQDDIRQELEDVEIPLTTKTITVTANGATIGLNGPWGGVRAGISIGIKF